MVDGAPEIVLDAIDLDENLIEVPLLWSMLSHVGSSFRPDLTSEDWTKAIAPVPHAFVTGVDSTLMEQVLDVSQR